jgi:subtilisin family serine protease
LIRGLFVLAAAAFTLPLGLAASAGPASARASFVEMIVTLTQPHAQSAVARQQAAFTKRLHDAVPDARVRWRYRIVLDGMAVVAPAGEASRISALPGVSEVYPSVTYHRSLYQSPQVIGAPQVWGAQLATAGQGIKIGIIDDGIDQSHPFFSPAGFTMPPGFPKGDRGYTSAKVIVARAFPPPGLKYRYAKVPFDPLESEHATHVAGIAAGDHGTTALGPNGRPVQVSGIAPRAYLGNYKVLTIPTAQFGLDGNSPEIVAGIEAAVRDGMNVINLSLGEPEITPSRDVVVQAIRGAARAGVVPVIAAGNDFDALGYGSIDSPGSATAAITVAAATKGGAITSFSSGGPTPYSLHLKPDVSAPGASILSSVPAHDGSWQFFDGTSMASPHVAGAAAVLLQRHPSWSVAEIKSALVLTGNPVRANGREVPPTREGGGMIWLPRADQPLIFSSPTSLSLGYLHRGKSLRRRVSLTDAGGGAGAWGVSLERMVSSRGVAISAPPSVVAPGSLTLRAAATRRAASGDSSGFVVLTRGGQTRRIPYWVHLTARRLAAEPRTVLGRPGVYHGDTRRGRSLVSTYRYPSGASSSGLRARLPGPEQVFRLVVRGHMTNIGARVISRGPGVVVSPRLVRAGDEDQLTGYAGLPLRIDPYEPDYYGIEPVVGAFRPAPGAYDLVFDTASRRVAGPFTFRYWVNDTTPPSARLLTGTVRSGAPLRLWVGDRGSGVDPTSMVARVDGKWRHIVYGGARVEVPTRGLSPGRHTLAFAVSDYQETKNTEDAAKTLPNTRRLVVRFVLR